ncbi:MAG: cellulase family glycosylhydrolase [Ruminococcus sp.]|nr:cellulase family glycosylhydrolase [Ruminococcus sp.]
MKKLRKTFAVTVSALCLLSAVYSCGDKKNGSDGGSASAGSDGAPQDSSQGSESAGEPETEAATQHSTPIETLSAECATQQTVSQTILRDHGSNTLKLPLSDFIEEGDTVSSFTFIIYSADGYNIGEYKGGCGISVSDGCPAKTGDGWYQTPDFTAPTQGSYGEIKWDVPADIRDYIDPDGEVLFGYWWGGAGSVRIEEVVCTYTRTRDIPVDGTVSQQVGRSVSFGSDDNTITIPTAELLPKGAVPEAVTFSVSADGGFRKFTGGFGYSSSLGSYRSPDTAVFTDSSSLELTWFVPDEAKDYIAEDGELMLGYWWSEQPTMTLGDVTVKYSGGDGNVPATAHSVSKPPSTSKTGFRTSAEIVDDIKVGWNLGNTLESYNTGKSGLSTETGWGNMKTTEKMIIGVKDAGFNAIRIPVTWDEHMDGDRIQQDWLGRVREVVDYAYNNDMYVILNMHHDDYIWFDPNDSEYAGDSAKLISIWEQIAAEFKDYGDRLLFEGMNEPRTIGSSAEWMGGTPAEREIVNKYEQDFVDTVRKSGGNNSERTLIVTSYAASAEDAAMNDVVVPYDSHVIVSLHYYAPWRFASGESTDFTDSDKSELDAKFTKMKRKFINNGTPVIIGEFGCVAKADDETRAEYYSYYLSAAKARGIKCCIWDNGVSSGSDGYGIYNRGAGKWNETILAGIMEGAE